MKGKELITAVLIAISFSLNCNAQFYTVTRQPKTVETIEDYKIQRVDTLVIIDTIVEKDTVDISVKREDFKAVRDAYKIRKSTRKDSEYRQSRRKDIDYELPKLTLLNLYDEIVKNGIQHPKIVLAQAILETGWFQSHVCRTKHNLFGLTNPRTTQYYEFNHWTESVRAYYTKVQYRYKGGDYLQWLDKIGYAEAPDYVPALKKILSTYLE